MKRPMPNFFYYVLALLILGCNMGLCDHDNSVSVIIPCTRSHAVFLFRLLEELNSQTKLPDEVVISISSLKSDDKELFLQIENYKWDFCLKIIKSTRRQFAGENRNIAIENSRGDLIICQDADDLPHRQRIELIYNFYKKTNFDLLIHQYLKYLEEFNPESEHRFKDYNSLEYLPQMCGLLKISSTDTMELGKKNPDFFYKNFPYGLKGHRLSSHHGNCAMKRTLFSRFKYNSKPSGQDVNFCHDVISSGLSVYFANVPLVYYLIDRSARIERER